MAMRSLSPVTAVLNQTVSTSTPVQSTPFKLGFTSSAQVAYLVVVGSGLTATFKIMVSLDGVTYYDSGQVLPSVSGSAASFVAQYSGAFPYVLMQVTQSGGSANVKITGCAKGGA